MVSCCVPDCNNHSEKTKRRGNTEGYHVIPQDHRTKAWLERIRRSDMPPLENSYVCSEHFLPSCFELDLRAQLTGEKGKRQLRDDAIPSVFKYSHDHEAKKPRLSSELRLKRQRHQEISRRLITYLYLYLTQNFGKLMRDRP